MSDKKWYFNMVTGEPELGPLSPIDRRMGPYESREDAMNAWEIVHERNRRWEEQDRNWSGGAD